MNEMRRGTALVTGASSGIGSAVAIGLVERGWRVVCAARRIDKLTSLAHSIGPAALAIELDVADAESVASLPQRLPGEWGSVDLLVNSAGHDVGGRQRFDMGAIDDWVATINTNVIGMMRVTHVLLPGMVERGCGHVVNIGSIMALEVQPGAVAYTASKFAVNGFSHALRADFKGKGVRVTQVLPGLVKTEFAQTRWAGDSKRAEEFYGTFPLVLDAADIARAVVYAAEQPPRTVVADLVIVPSS